MIGIFRTGILPMSNDQKPVIIVIIILLGMWHRLGQLDGLLQPGVQPVVGLVAEAAEGQRQRLHVQRLQWLKRLDGFLVAFVKRDVTLVKHRFQGNVVVVGAAYVVVDCAIVIVVYVESLH